VTLPTQQNDNCPAGKAESGNEPELEKGRAEPNAPKISALETSEIPCAQGQPAKSQHTQKYLNCRPTTQTVLPMLGNLPLA